MKTKIHLIIFLLHALTIASYSQDNTFEYFITVNTNLYLPINNSNKGMYPILWYDKANDPKIMVGGFGVGFTMLKSFKEKLNLKGQGNFSRHTYWDDPSILTTITNQPFASISPKTSDYTLGLAGLFHYALSKKISVGTGLGAQILFVSRSRSVLLYADEPLNFVNNYYKPFMPVVPLELSFKSKRTLLNIRYEYGLLNRIRGDLAKEQTDRFGLLTFEIGFRIK